MLPWNQSRGRFNIRQTRQATKGLFTWRWDISNLRDISPSRDNFVPGSHENWVGYYPGAIRTRHNNTRENCILNVQDGVQQKLCFISFLDTFSFCCCSILIKWISSCKLCSHLAPAISTKIYVRFHVRILVMPITVEVVPASEISRCRAFTWIIVVPVNRVTWVVQARYLGPPSYPGFMWTDKLSKQRNTCALCWQAKDCLDRKYYILPY